MPHHPGQHRYHDKGYAEPEPEELRGRCSTRTGILVVFRRNRFPRVNAPARRSVLEGRLSSPSYQWSSYRDIHDISFRICRTAARPIRIAFWMPVTAKDVAAVQRRETVAGGWGLYTAVLRTLRTLPQTTNALKISSAAIWGISSMMPASLRTTPRSISIMCVAGSALPIQ